MSIPLSLWAPARSPGRANQRGCCSAIMLCYPVGYVGPDRRPARPARSSGRCSSASRLATFPIVLTLIGLRSRTPEGTAALSGFTQSTGYLIAAIGPFGVGILHELTGGWTVAARAR